MKKIISSKKYLILLAMMITMLLVGCGEDHPVSVFINTTLPKILSERVKYNQEVLTSLKTAGMISNDTFEKHNKYLTEQKNVYLENASSENAAIKADADEKFAKAICRYRRLSDANVKSLKVGEKTYKGKELNTYLNNNALTNIAIDNNKSSNKDISRISKYFTYNKTTFCNYEHEMYINAKSNPITLVKKDNNLIVDYEIYVLKADVSSTGNNKTISEAMSTIKDSITVDNTTNSHKVKGDKVDSLLKYFEPAKYTEDTVVFKGTDSEKTVKKGDKVLMNHLVNSSTLTGLSKYRKDTEDSSNKPGIDLRFSQKLGNKNIILGDVKFREFYQDEVDKLNTLVGIDKETNKSTVKWATYTKDGKKYAFLLEYPVYYIKGLQDKANNSNISEAIIDKSDMGVNLRTGKMVRYEYNTDAKGNKTSIAKFSVISNYGEDVGSDTAYLILDGKGTSNDESRSAFFLSGVGKHDIGINFTDGAKISLPVTTGRIILRDYLESTYAPEADLNNQGSGLVVFGRKLRFVNIKAEKIKYKTDVTESGDIRYRDGTTSSGDKSEAYTSGIAQTRIYFNKDTDCAKFVDKDGLELINAKGLRVEDLCDCVDITTTKDSEDNTISRKVVTPTAYGVAADSGEATDPEKGDVNSLPWESTGDFVRTSLKFPGPQIGTTDNGIDIQNIGTKEKIHQVFYTITTNSDMFETKLFDSWINSANESASLGWWHDWLSKNEYKYSLSSVDIENFLNENYAYEMSQSGIIILDLEVVAKIQEQMNQESEAESARMFRTIFLIIGWVLVLYAVILILAWLLDTNLDLGIGLVEKLTFGHWVPVKYIEDIPNSDAEARQYVTLGAISIRCLIIAAVGILLILIDVLDILLFLLGTLGIFADKVSQLITR